MKSVGVVIPTKNAEHHLKQSLPAIRSLVPEASIFIVDNLSEDNTIQVAKSFGSEVFAIKGYGFGYGVSLLIGLKFAVYSDCDYIVEMDADHPPEVLKKIIKQLDEGADMVIGVETGLRPSRLVANFLTRKFLGLQKFRHTTCGYIGFKRLALLRILKKRVEADNDFIHIELLHEANKLGLSFAEVEFDGKLHEKGVMRLNRISKWLLSFGTFIIKEKLL